MRRATIVAMAAGLLLSLLAAPAAAHTTTLDGPAPAFWLSDPEGDVGDDEDHGIEQFDPVEGSSGKATVNHNGATITVHVTGLAAGHIYTMWIVYFNDQTLCPVAGCGEADLAQGGVTFGDGKAVGGSGKATFSGRINEGDTGTLFGVEYDANPDNEFHIVIRSHGPAIPGQVADQMHTVGGGCVVEVGPEPGQMGDFPVPANPGECGDVQLYVFS